MPGKGAGVWPAAPCVLPSRAFGRGAQRPGSHVDLLADLPAYASLLDLDGYESIAQWCSGGWLTHPRMRASFPRCVRRFFVPRPPWRRSRRLSFPSPRCSFRPWRGRYTQVRSVSVPPRRLDAGCSDLQRRDHSRSCEEAANVPEGRQPDRSVEANRRHARHRDPRLRDRGDSHHPGHGAAQSCGTSENHLDDAGSVQLAGHRSRFLPLLFLARWRDPHACSALVCRSAAGPV